VREVVLPPIQNVVGIRKQITILILQQVTSWLVTPPKFIYSPIQVSDVLVRTVRYKFIIFIIEKWNMETSEWPVEINGKLKMLI
jgi:hypothetical protein